jgi:hypothetical protein
MTDPEITRLQYHNDRLRELVDRLEFEKKAMQAKHDELLKTACKLESYNKALKVMLMDVLPPDVTASDIETLLNHLSDEVVLQ